MTDKDIKDFLNIVRKQNKRKMVNVDDTEIINDLKWIAYDTIIDFVKNSKSKTNRQITSSLNILEHIFKDSSKLFMEMTKDDEIKLTMNAFSYILLAVASQL